FNLNKIYFISIGDSRIFIKKNNENPELISKDDSIAFPVTINKKIVMKDGVPVISIPITKAIGQRDILEFEINMHSFSAGESVILATDGIHDHGILPYNISDLINQKNISTKLQSAVSECSRENNDDATILILRRNDFPSGSKSLYRDAILNNIDFTSEKLFGHLLTDCAVELVNQSIEFDDWAKVKQCLNYLSDQRLLLTKETLIDWLNLVLTKNANDRKIISLLKELIRISS
ncbi:MAG: hypothetical protein IH595_10495, partial [Bacteroidales bacterium]|nr:hypothetical protein [Bacteroidales bacterium]